MLDRLSIRIQWSDLFNISVRLTKNEGQIYQKLNGKIWQQIYQNVPNNNQLSFSSPTLLCRALASKSAKEPFKREIIEKKEI